MELELCRTYYATGTNGCLFAGTEFICFTIELPWLENIKQRSCIPEGRYRIIPRVSPRFGEHILVHEVPFRNGILIHAANNALKELKGCIAPVSIVTAPGCGLDSRRALIRLVQLVKVFREPVFLKISSI